MRIRRLTLAGFGPYCDEQVVDFDRFESDGIFLITGKTGAGKSSILDAICFALYGSVPRYDGAHAQLRSDHARPDDPTFVELEFTVRGVDYTVRRTPEYQRPSKKAGGKLVKQAHDARLSIGDEVIAARPVDVAHEIARIVTLTKEQFLQVVLLAQNRFQEFLLAKNDERQAVLRTLFSSQRFEQLEQALDERRKALQAELAGADGVLEEYAAQAVRLLGAEESPPPAGAAADTEWFVASRDALSSRAAAASTDAVTADVEFTAADGAHRLLLERLSHQGRRDAALAALDVLQLEAPRIEEDRRELEGARRAAPVWPQVVAVRSAEAELEAAKLAEGEAERALAPYGAEPDRDGLGATITDLSAALGALAEVLADERTLPAITTEIDGLTAARDEADLRLETAVARSLEVPGELESIGSRITEESIRAARISDARESRDRIAGARDAAAKAVQLAARLESAQTAEAAAWSDHTAAAVALDTLLDRRLGGHAAELAAALVEGEACAVCGATAHPSPAQPAGDAVTEADVEEARDTIADRRSALDVAHAEVLALSSGVTEARTRAGDQVAADEDVLAATHAVSRLAGLEHERARLSDELAALRADADTLRASRSAIAERLAEATSRRTTILERVERQRGDAPSVTHRAAALEAHLAAARALESAARLSRSRREARDLAAQSLRVQLLEHGFAQDAEAAVAEVEAARRTAQQIADFEKRLRRHDEAIATARATLAEPAIAAVGPERVDPEPSEQRRLEALAARDAALARSTSLEQRLEQLVGVVAAAITHLERVGERRREFAQLRELASVVRGDEPNTRRMRLETYVLAAQLEEIVAAANSRLRTMSAGRYALEHDDSLQYRRAQSGLGLSILDEHTGRSRPTHSLSGGETFLASLALALGLAEVVTNQAGGITLDTLFVDEGFGSLDSETLEIAMSTLDGLRTGGRTVGLISHVEAMKEQITAHLRITVSSRGDSTIEQAVAGA